MSYLGTFIPQREKPLRLDTVELGKFRAKQRMYRIDFFIEET